MGRASDKVEVERGWGAEEDGGVERAG